MISSVDSLRSVALLSGIGTSLASGFMMWVNENTVIPMSNYNLRALFVLVGIGLGFMVPVFYRLALRSRSKNR